MTELIQLKLGLDALVPAIDEVVDGAAPVDTRSHQARVISPVDVPYPVIEGGLHTPRPGDPNWMPDDPVEYVVNRETGTGADAGTDTVQRDAGVARPAADSSDPIVDLEDAV